MLPDHLSRSCCLLDGKQAQFRNCLTLLFCSTGTFVREGTSLKAIGTICSVSFLNEKDAWLKSLFKCKGLKARGGGVNLINLTYTRRYCNCSGMKTCFAREVSSMILSTEISLNATCMLLFQSRRSTTPKVGCYSKPHTVYTGSRKKDWQKGDSSNCHKRDKKAEWKKRAHEMIK